MQSQPLLSFGNDSDTTMSTRSEKDVDERLHDGEVSWTPEEEKKVVRKLDCIVMPLLILVFIGLQLDRGNIGNALTDDFLDNVGISQNQFNVGQQLLYLGIVLLEIPSNMILFYIGPLWWLSAQVMAWAMVSIFQAFQHGHRAFFATRILLGICEAGFIPASLYIITVWYKNSEVSARFSWYFLGYFFALGSSGLLAFGILRMRGLGGLTGWQWLFILEGLYTVLAGVLLICFLPEHRDKPYPFTQINYFTERERYIIARRVPLDDPAKLAKKRSISVRDLRQALGNWKMWLHFMLCLATIGPVTALNTYAPSLVRGLGYNRLDANAYVSIGTWIQICLVPIAGWTADKTQRRGLVVLAGQLCWFLLLLGNLLAINSNKSGRLGILIMALAVTQCWHPINSSWLSINASSPAERSIYMACIIISANLAGVYGAQIFRQDDAPKYYRAWKTTTSILAFGVVIGIFTNVAYYLLNRQAAKKEQKEGIQVRRYHV
ncbi:MAG: hypothetical protein Q9170_000474 [Blastenia crenularia]